MRTFSMMGKLDNYPATHSIESFYKPLPNQALDLLMLPKGHLAVAMLNSSFKSLGLCY